MLSSGNFWKDLKGPLYMLAPMEDVTDTAFRELVMRISTPGLPHILFTEFTSVDGLCHPVGREKVSYRLKVSDSERELLDTLGIKLIAQVWGNDPEKFSSALKYIEEEYSFDAIDINMGCPVKNVVAHGSGSALIDSETQAGEIIAAARESLTLPLSVKTRIGFKYKDTERWISYLLSQPLDAITVHGRIQKQMSEGEADWNEIGRAVGLRNAIAPDIKLIGNGDVSSLEEANEKIAKYGTDGIMFGRGIFRNPWLFYPFNIDIGIKERIEALRLHLDLFKKAWGEGRHFPILKRFFKIYLSDFPGAASFRSAMMDVNSFDEAEYIIESFSMGKIPGS